MALRRLPLAVGLLVVGLLIPVLTYADPQYDAIGRRFINSTGVKKDTLYVQLSEIINATTHITGYSPFDSAYNYPADSTIIIFSPGTVVEPGDSLAAGDTTDCIRFLGEAGGGIAVVSAKWTGGVVLAGGDIKTCTVSYTPFLGTWGILALLLLLAATAWFVLSRRKVRTTGSAA